ncbi:MAG: hypothetical protein Edafosvirus2_94 [Edafosvirus sp.]|uniref:Uncharacterized protein n=1 Tax=Edafosvirus sp. TaxID=2487765 RepID=A0A3G4ZSQ4_9VIRU|nr:MAG: hypothetical protein Edafosvirus2_94 [Edafosvirus sp.]
MLCYFIMITINQLEKNLNNSCTDMYIINLSYVKK